MKIEKTNIGFRIINPGQLEIGTYGRDHRLWDAIKDVAKKLFGHMLKKNDVLIRVESWRGGEVWYEYLCDPHVYVSENIGLQVMTQTPDLDEYDSGPDGVIEDDVKEQVMILLKDIPGVKGLTLERIQRRQGLAQYSFRKLDFVPAWMTNEYILTPEQAKKHLDRLKEINNREK